MFSACFSCHILEYEALEEAVFETRGYNTGLKFTAILMGQDRKPNQNVYLGGTLHVEEFSMLQENILWF